MWQFKLCLVLVVCVWYIIPSSANMTEREKRKILRMHNRARFRIMKCKVPGQPAPDKMYKLKWDDDLARNAHTWASKCTAGHDSREERATKKFESVGQNWAGAQDMKQIFDMWFDEYKDYDYDTRQCSNVCTHYTQVVDIRSTHVGCAKVDCPEPYRYGKSWVCNYGPA